MEINTRGTFLKSGNGADEASLNKAAASVHGAVDKVAAAVGEAANKVPPAIERIAEAAHTTVDKVADAAEPTATWLRSQGEQLKVRQQKATAGAERYVSANPWKALGFALAAGFILSRVVR